jgi:hypothetical protein
MTTTIQGVHQVGGGVAPRLPKAVLEEQLERRLARQERTIARLKEYVERGENVDRSGFCGFPPRGQIAGHPGWVRSRWLRGAYKLRHRWEMAQQRLHDEGKRQKITERRRAKEDMELVGRIEETDPYEGPDSK